VTPEFKAEAERLALAERKALRLTSRCRLDPVRLAASKQIPVVPLGELRFIAPEHVHRLKRVDRMAFSAAAVVEENDALIVVNDGHTPQRQANSVAHELAHMILGHPAGAAFDEFGSRTLTRAHEAEANWLASCMLVPAAGIRPTMLRYDHDVHRAAEHYGVSVGLLRRRLLHVRYEPAG
jgi:predicted transcriptional regulator